MAMSSSILDHKTLESETFCLENAKVICQGMETYVTLSVIFLPFKTADIIVFLTGLI